MRPEWARSCDLGHSGVSDMEKWPRPTENGSGLLSYRVVPYLGADLPLFSQPSLYGTAEQVIAEPNVSFGKSGKAFAKIGV